MITGTIVQVNWRNLTMICRDEFNKSHAIAVSATATITRNGLDAKLSELRADDMVKLSHDSPVSVVKAREA